MKKKTLVISALLVLTEIALVCYFAGCSTKSLKMRKSQVAKPSPIRMASVEAKRPGEPLPTELVNISEDEIWVIARPETQIRGYSTVSQSLR
ncbi:MAG: hypothetical protein ACYSU5_25925 [Planctomycetota bacterium]